MFTVNITQPSRDLHGGLTKVGFQQAQKLVKTLNINFYSMLKAFKVHCITCLFSKTNQNNCDSMGWICEETICVAAYKRTIFTRCLRGYWTLVLKTLYTARIFSKNKATWDNFINGIWLECSMELKKSQFCFSRYHGFEVTVKIVWKSIFSMIWFIINNHLSWGNSSAILGSLECYLQETYLTCHQCVVILRKMNKQSRNWSGMQYPLKL